MSTPPNPRRGEVWDICFDPSVGAEIQKTRPAVVVNIESVGRLPLRMVSGLSLASGVKWEREAYGPIDADFAVSKRIELEVV